MQQLNSSGSIPVNAPVRSCGLYATVLYLNLGSMLKRERDDQLFVMKNMGCWVFAPRASFDLYRGPFRKRWNTRVARSNGDPASACYANHVSR